MERNYPRTRWLGKTNKYYRVLWRHILGSLVLGVADGGWKSLIDGKLEYLEAEKVEDAKNEMKIVLENHFEGERNYYDELLDMLQDLN